MDDVRQTASLNYAVYALTSLTELLVTLFLFYTIQNAVFVLDCVYKNSNN